MSQVDDSTENSEGQSQEEVSINVESQEAAPEQTREELIKDILSSKDGENAEDVKVEAKEEAPKVEEPKKEEPKSEEDRKFAAKFAALSKREKADRERAKALDNREKQLQARIAELEGKAKPAAEPEKEPIERRLKRDPFNTLKELGLDFDALTKIALNEGKLTPEMQLRLQQEEIDRKYETKLEALEKRLAEKEAKEVADRQSAQEQQAISEFKSSIESHIKSDPAAYEMISIEGEEALDVVYQVIEQHYSETGKVMSVKEAADVVEEHLLESAKKYTNLSKIKGLFGAANQPAPQAAPSAAAKGASPTLSNAQSAAVPAKKASNLTREQEFAEAARLLKFQQ